MYRRHTVKALAADRRTDCPNRALPIGAGAQDGDGLADLAFAELGAIVALHGFQQCDECCYGCQVKLSHRGAWRRVAPHCAVVSDARPSI